MKTKLSNAFILVENGEKVRHESWDEGEYVEGVLNLVLALRGFLYAEQSLEGWRKYKE